MTKINQSSPKFIGGDDKAIKLKNNLDHVIQNYKSTIPSLKGNTELRVKAFIMLFLYIVPFCLLVIYSPSGWVAVLLLAILGFGKVGSALNIMHDAAHGAFSENKWVNWLMSRTIYLQGDNLLNWKIQHNYYHHRYTNIHDLDEDIEPPWFLRFSENSPLRKIHRFQHIVAPFFYGFLTLGRFFGEIGKMLQYDKEQLPKQYSFTLGWEILKVSFLKIVYLFVAIVLPILITDYSWWQVLLGFFSVHYFSSILISFIFQTAHVVEGLEQHPEVTEGSNIDAHAYVHQIRTTCNFKTTKFFSWFIGGLNCQVEHHLYPTMSHVHYKKIASKIKEAIQGTSNNPNNFGYQYNEKSSFIAACISHLRKLKELGMQPQR
ncbi:acyl-CoA desaturase [Candidatus Falkowbacteria bacterium]|nr:MAG: acyl-CoA desaturase [Candidatus Falkowbacteria bacterium]